MVTILYNSLLIIFEVMEREQVKAKIHNQFFIIFWLTVFKWQFLEIINTLIIFAVK